jgi:hypothetical protein
LQAVRILEFVDEDVAKALGVMRAQHFVALEQLVRSQQELSEVDDALCPALLVVRSIKIDEAACALVGDMNIPGAQALFLVSIDEGLHLARREAILVGVQTLEHSLYCRELVLRIEDLKRLRQTCIAVVKPQHPVGETVKRSNPHPAQIDRQHRREAGEHFSRRLVGKGDRKHGTGRRVPFLD